MPSSRSTDTEPRIVFNALPAGKADVRITDGLERQGPAICAALFAAWTAMPVALWLAALGLFFGAIVGFAGLGSLAGHLGIVGSLLNNLGGGLLGALLGAVLGMVGGFILIYAYLFTHPLQFTGSLILGAFVAFLIVTAVINLEPFILIHLRGYRMPSRRERAKLNPLLLDAAERMGLAVVPDFWVSDMTKPAAWAHLRALVVSRGLLGNYDASENPPDPDLDDAAITAILAHELHHWEKGDALAASMVTACFAPFVVILDAMQWLQERSRAFAPLLWLLFWPVWVCSRFVIAPLVATASRDHEYEADARAASLGEPYRLGLRRALTELSAWEIPRTGWEQILTSAYPPTEMRLESLEASPATETETPKAPQTPVRERRRAKTPSPNLPSEHHEPVAEPTRATPTGVPFGGTPKQPDVVLTSTAVEAAARTRAAADARYKGAKTRRHAAEIALTLQDSRAATLTERRAVLEAIEAGEYEVVGDIGADWREEQKASLAATIKRLEQEIRQTDGAKPEPGITSSSRSTQEPARRAKPKPRPRKAPATDAPPASSTTTDQTDDADLRWSFEVPSDPKRGSDPAPQ